MASIEGGMANGTRKPDYMNSFMSFLENDRGNDQGSHQMVNNVMDGVSNRGENEVSKDASPEDHPTEEAVPPTDHAPDEPEPSGTQLEDEASADGSNPEDPDDPATMNNDDQENSFDKQDQENSADPDYVAMEEPEDIKPTVLVGLGGDPETSSEATTGSEAGEGQPKRRNVARRGKKRGTGESVPSPLAIPQRDTPRRTARSVQRYGHLDIDTEAVMDSDPEFHLSDSDDDPDFSPVKKSANNATDEDDSRPRRGRGRGRGAGGYRGIGPSLGRGRGVKRTIDNSETDSNNKSPPTTSPPKRRGRPPTYQSATPNASGTNSGSGGGDGVGVGGGGGGGGGGGSSGSDAGGQDNTVTSTDEKKTSKLSSAYNYAGTGNFGGARGQRQSLTIKLPEGPQLTSEQLAMVESQFKSGEFVMAKKDMDMMEHPPIWRIDGKSLLQKFQAFDKDGKTLYRNISTYSGWTSQAKALYVGVRVTFVFQSRYDTVVELVGIKDGNEEEPPQKPKDTQEQQNWTAVKKQQDIQISEELRSHTPSFEIYLQTLISQALDNNFLMEIYAENDDYFVERVKVIDDLAEQRKTKVLEMVDWNERFKTSLDTWPCINVMVTNNGDQCQACNRQPATKLTQLYGQPYSQQTLRSREPVPSELESKNFEVCERCSNLSQMYNKVSHQKYDYYSQCKSTVTNMRVTHPSKHTTSILRDLLANDHWITGLFRSMCTTWIKVDRLHQDYTQGDIKQGDGMT